MSPMETLINEATSYFQKTTTNEARCQGTQVVAHRSSLIPEIDLRVTPTEDLVSGRKKSSRPSLVKAYNKDPRCSSQRSAESLYMIRERREFSWPT